MSSVSDWGEIEFPQGGSSIVSDWRETKFAQGDSSMQPCVLLLNTSSSMGKARSDGTRPIDALNKGLATFKEELMKDALAASRVEVAVVTFDSDVSIVQDFVTVDKFQPPTLTAQGQTDMGRGIQMALDMVQARKEKYKSNGVSYYRPWVFMITDGESTTDTSQVAQRIKDYEANKRVAFFAVGVANASMEKLKQISVRRPLHLKGLEFDKMFVWLSASMAGDIERDSEEPDLCAEADEVDNPRSDLHGSWDEV